MPRAERYCMVTNNVAERAVYKSLSEDTQAPTPSSK